MEFIEDHVHEFMTFPFLVIQGTEDKLVDPRGAEMLVEKAAATDKMLKMYKGGYHEMLNEPEKDQVTQHIIEWMNERLEGHLRQKSQRHGCGLLACLEESKCKTQTTKRATQSET